MTRAFVGLAESTAMMLSNEDIVYRRDSRNLAETRERTDIERMRYVIALLAVLIAPTVALAGKDDCRWQPPIQYRGEPTAPYKVVKMVQPKIQAACTAAAKRHGWPVVKNFRGCAVPGKVWKVYVVKGGFMCASEAAIIEHELGHVNGWGHNH